MISYVLMDIEGTTTPITFVHDVLFPYSARRLANYVNEHKADPVVRKALDDTIKTVLEEERSKIGDAQAVLQLLHWIDADRKHSALKTLQGLVWRRGYEEKAYTAKVYDDVAPALKRWSDKGLTLGIYSSGSVDAQVLLFKYSDQGDLTPLLSHHFDTAIGQKRDASSYQAITKSLGRPAAEILFLSDIEAELDAAREAGLATIQIVRPGTRAGDLHKVAHDFTEVDSDLA